MTAFYVAMAFLESAVVVYLRALYYPKGFAFPLVSMDKVLVGTEVWREVATLIMLLAPAAVLTRSVLERCAWFCFGFGVWDLFYYVWLKVLLDWPSSLTDPDLLFLVPVPWVGPVWSPCVVSLGLIAIALAILRQRSLHPDFMVDLWTWVLFAIGALVIIVAFTLEPLQRSFGLAALTDPGLPQRAMATALGNGPAYVPLYFPWWFFVLGCALAALGLARILRPKVGPS